MWQGWVWISGKALLPHFPQQKVKKSCLNLKQTNKRTQEVGACIIQRQRGKQKDHLQEWRVVPLESEQGHVEYIFDTLNTHIIFIKLKII